MPRTDGVVRTVLELLHHSRRSEALRRSLPRHGETVIFLYAGRLSVEKNLEYLGPMIAGVPGARLVLVGDGPRRAALESQFHTLPVTFLGMRHGEDLAAIYASADIFAFPSRTETFGQVVQEAMASGMPVLAYRAGGVRDLPRDGWEGYLCPPDDSARWRETARRLATDREQRAPGQPGTHRGGWTYLGWDLWRPTARVRGPGNQYIRRCAPCCWRTVQACRGIIEECVYGGRNGRHEKGTWHGGPAHPHLLFGRAAHGAHGAGSRGAAYPLGGDRDHRP